MFITVALAGETTNRIIVNADLGKEQISKHIYGHFAEHLGNCIYGGFWVGEDSPIPNTRGIRNDVLEAMREIKPPVIRWPGGCFADTYHWKDGIGPRANRPSIINTNWGGVTEDNSFGTHEFLDLCELLECEPYICVNVGSGTVQEAAEWVEYINSDAVSPMTELRKKNGREKPWNVKYWAVGNESWGCGGNMTPEYYADQFKRYATYMNAGRLYKVASGGTDPDFAWTRTVMQKTQAYPNLIQGYSFHYYSFCRGWNDKSSAIQFNENDWFNTMKVTWVVDERLRQHSSIMDEFDPNNRIGLIADEWGNWFWVEPGTNPGFLYQQNTVRDAVTAALYLNIFNNQCRRVKMANIAQTINVLQAMLLTKDNQIVKTPTFYVFKMFKVHQDATMLPLDIQCEDYKFEKEQVPAVSASASRDAQGKVHISLANMNPNKNIELSIDVRGAAKFAKSAGEIITGPAMNSYNDFGKPEQVNIQAFKDFKIKDNSLVINLPSKSVVTLELSN
ncbi:MAG TPA: alpha-L-arabinofuranosidase C-terminal domain-containing protein [bacterium]|nr:alpha-L-arabinofuranosidase C-terminal domain-containing protein [bacterium]HPN45660.1 alpha-L-arabinofuranosidase C-terminal domain-containing protein [bacterium]